MRALEGRNNEMHRMKEQIKDLEVKEWGWSEGVGGGEIVGGCEGKVFV